MTTSVNSTTSTTATTTSRGTKIVKSSGGLDKNAFLKILTTELSNQDPDNTKDSTEYVAQMAQFSSLEQMSNLNTNIALSSANSMIGKAVALSDLDSNGNQYTGTVKSVTRSGSTITLNVDVGTGTTSDIKQFSYDNVVGVTNNPNETTSVSGTELSLLAEAAMIGKKATFNSKDSSGNNYAGLIQGITNNNGVLDLNVLLDNSTTTKQFTLDQLLDLTSGS